MPGFEKRPLVSAAPFLGIRETSRIVGRYVMTADDILGCRRFDDAIAVASYPIDLHRPSDNDCTMEWCGDCYDIPYRSLVPQAVEQSARGRAVHLDDARGDGGDPGDVDLHGHRRGGRPGGPTGVSRRGVARQGGRGRAAERAALARGVSALTEREVGQPHDLAALFCRLVGADADAGPVGAGHGVGPRVAVLDQGADELVDQVRMRAAVARRLG